MFLIHFLNSLTGSTSRSLMAFDSLSLQWTSLTSVQKGSLPPSMYGFAMCSMNQDIFVFGGASISQSYGDLYQFDPYTITWKKIEIYQNRPSPRLIPMMVSLSKKNLLYVYGGMDQFLNIINQDWVHTYKGPAALLQFVCIVLTISVD
jgi:hypothetical protein